MKCIPREIFQKEEYLNSLICTIGYGIFRDPIALPCQHVFCRGCIEKSNATTGCGTCPICFEPWSKEQLKVQLEIAEVIDQSTVTCERCDWIGQYQNLDKHLKTSCKNSLVTCQFGCGISLPRKCLIEHEQICKFKKAECKYCKKEMTYLELTKHEDCCTERNANCPVCGIVLKFYEVEIHTKNTHSDNAVCEFGFAGCLFAARDRTILERHYEEFAEKHLDMLNKVVLLLQSRLEKIEKNGVRSFMAESSIPTKDYQIEPKIFPVKWSTGSNKLLGAKKGSWTFFLSNTQVYGNFLAKIRILNLGNDANTWKMCLGLFNSARFQAGSWDKYKNGWGYILGNGNKIHESPASSYGPSYGTGDNIWIEYKNGNITFYKNGANPGVAFSGVSGPFYIAAALSDSGHNIELIEVVELLK